jgi:hypothetical protein
MEVSGQLQTPADLYREEILEYQLDMRLSGTGTKGKFDIVLVATLHIRDYKTNQTYFWMKCGIKITSNP